MHVNGAKVGFYQGNIKTLMDDIAALKPTVFPTVPRLLNRLHDKVGSLRAGGCVLPLPPENAVSSCMCSFCPLWHCSYIGCHSFPPSVFSQVMASISSNPVKKALFDMALAYKTSEVER